MEVNIFWEKEEEIFIFAIWNMNNSKQIAINVKTCVRLIHKYLSTNLPGSYLSRLLADVPILSAILINLTHQIVAKCTWFILCSI